ncbi:MAG: PKD domain-containing protein [Bacteroidales bacterium]|nr:PKD domain-containing protein [Bacteroidales bacterium]MCF8386853.1 PKD domain-containing protein [Bacteroidales bacterium]MCF8399271.1 PKD domain-containing protein [Bacteroidales bacterium]
MKKLSFRMLMLLMAASMLVVTSCKDDDDDDPDPQPTNTKPVASFEVTPVVGDIGEEFTFDASGSSDEETPADALQVRWDWESDGTYDTDYATEKTATHSWAAAGEYVVTMEVKDGGGLTSTTQRTAYVGEAPSEITLQGSITSDMALDASIKYILDGFVFVEDGATLTIPAGTLIEGNPGQGENASALIVKMGGKVEATGTASDPIVMTGLGDGKDGNYAKYVQGLWGGLIILGKAETNNSIAKRIEGLPEAFNAFYGFDGNVGANNDDNSGTFSYIQVRHGGTDIGAGNEINGISLGAVGRGTQLDHIEVISNKDDGMEFFGGVAEVKYALVALVGDDSFDTDEGFQGKGQFWCAIQGEETGDRLAEQDGGTGDDEEAAPYAQPTYYNFTYIGHGFDNYVIFRDNAAGIYANSIFAHGAQGLRIEYRDDKHSSYDWLTDASPEATLMIKNNLFSNIAEKYIYAKAESGTLPADHETVTNNLFNNNQNFAEDMGIDMDNVVPAAASAHPVAAKPVDDFFVDAPYHGAFQPGGTNWADGWTLYFK